jgi:predicted regulator of Ras-like GTPase activity (Roadblock/LC7/MglB family)
MKTSLDLQKALRSAGGLGMLAESDETGVVSNSAGSGDAETVCAVAGMCHHHFNTISELFGAGKVTAWALVTEKRALYLQTVDEGFLVGMGDSTRNAAATLKSLAKTASGA